MENEFIIDDDIFTEIAANDNLPSNIVINAEKMIFNDTNEDLDLISPPRLNTNNSTNEATPWTQMYNRFPELNMIITPNTLKNTLPPKANK